MKNFSSGAFAFLFSIVFTYIIGISACRKTDRVTINAEKERVNVEKFFTSHQSTNPTIIAAQEFVKNQNDSFHFVENLVKKIGFPYWDKSLVFSKPGSRNFNDIESK